MGWHAIKINQLFNQNNWMKLQKRNIDLLYTICFYCLGFRSVSYSFNSCLKLIATILVLILKRTNASLYKKIILSDALGKSVIVNYLISKDFFIGRNEQKKKIYTFPGKNYVISTLRGHAFFFF